MTEEGAARDGLARSNPRQVADDTGSPLLVQGIAWVPFFPVLGGLWVWETSWPAVLRLVLVVGLAGWSLMIFVPRSTQG